MAVASMIVLPNHLSDKRDAAGNILFPMLSEAEKADIRLHDLAVIRDPYVALGVVAQVFYVAAQIMVWTFIIQYADNLGISKATAQNY